jgi:hypothetical protein
MLILKIAAIALVGGLAACNDRSESTSPTRLEARSRSTAADWQILRPTFARALVDHELRLELSIGDLDGATQRAWPDRFDHFVARLGGWQGLLEPDDRDGTAGVSLAFTEPGDALVGYSTLPRRLGTDDDAAIVSHHVKCMFPVRRDTAEPLPASAALSRRIGMPLELVPLIDPLTLLPGDDLPVQVRFDGPSLANAPIEVRHRIPGRRSPGSTFRGVTDDSGTAIVQIRGAGEHLVLASHEAQSVDGGRHIHRATLWFAIGAPR